MEAALGPVTGVRSAHVEPTTGTWTVWLRHAHPNALGPAAGHLHPADLASAHDELASTLTMSLRTPVTPSVLRVTVHGRGGVLELDERSTPPLDCYRVMLDEFLEAAARGEEHPCSAAHGLHLARVTDQVRRVAAP